jgi:hypothetical protein
MAARGITEPVGIGARREEDCDERLCKPVSRELVLVSPAELAQRARSALPDRYGVQPTRIPDSVPLVRGGTRFA